MMDDIIRSMEHLINLNTFFKIFDDKGEDYYNDEGEKIFGPLPRTATEQDFDALFYQKAREKQAEHVNGGTRELAALLIVEINRLCQL